MRHIVPALEDVRGQLADIELAGGNQGAQLLHAESAARHQAAVDRLVAHANAPLNAGDVDIGAAAEVVDVADLAAGLEALDAGFVGGDIAAGDDNLIDTLAAGQSENLLVDGAVLVADELVGAVELGGLDALRTGTDSQDAGGAAQGSTGHAHQADRADADNQDGITELNIGQLNAVEAGGHHVGEHAGVDNVDAVGQVSEVAVGVVDMEELGIEAILEVGELPAAQHTAGVHGVAALSLKGVPVGGDGGDENTVTGLEVLDHRANLDDFGAALVAEDHVVSLTDGALPDGMDVGGADGDGKGLADGVHRTAHRALLLDPANLTDLDHCKTLHKCLPPLNHL